VGGDSGGGVLGMGRGPDAGCHYQDPLDDATWLEAHGPEQANGLPYHKHGGHKRTGEYSGANLKLHWQGARG